MYHKKKECVAMLLAGGQGSRLMVLTEDTAKPAVPFGGKYRIIDFPLSNCVNSGIDTVGILTQYQPLELNDYIGNGGPWGLTSNFGGAHILPPYSKSKNSEWYKGTANAIYQNMSFIERYDPEYILILSGDHVYKMDYSKMLEYHKAKKAECTIAVLDVPIEEASRFGIMNLNKDGSIYEFEEKPKVPKSTKASMGIYIFNWKILKKYLIEDEEDKKSSKDFGKNVIPHLLGDGRKMFAYLFEGYWKDVGTIDSLWQSNMDLLNPDSGLNLEDPTFKIYARNYANPSSFVCKGSLIENSFVAEGCTVNGNIINSIISTGCYIEKGTQIENSVIMPNTRIEEGSLIKYAIVGEEATISNNSKVGDDPEGYSNSDWGIAVVGKGKTVDPDTVVKVKEVI
ncbi:MAG: glucose-1-phosphate adenylyltransferase [Bacillota bacterium]|nr:glucose-1-phosphate adenylyltransferase [Bacillota bacterium]